MIHVYLGEADVAIEHAHRALRLSPLDAFTQHVGQSAIAQAHFIAARYIGCQSPCQPAGGLSAVSAERLGEGPQPSAQGGRAQGDQLQDQAGDRARDRDALLAFYDFPAEHWKHLRTTNVIESSFATARHRTVRSKGCLSNKTALAMIFKLAEAAEKHWRRLDGHNQLPKVILGVKFTDGIEVVRSQAQAAAA